MTRRQLFQITGLAAISSKFARAAGPRNIVISSSNGMACCAKAHEILRSGGDTLDAVIAGVNINELDPNEHGVGYGGLPNEDGVVELDSSVMHGPSRGAGSVASIRNIKTPSKVAKLVMEESDHVMLVGQGALEFAKAQGFQEDNLLVEDSRIAWMTWKESMRDERGHNNWGPGLDSPLYGKRKERKMAQLMERFPQAKPEVLEWAMEMAVHPITGTINCLALNSKGEMSGVTTTSGLAWKIAGRVGDSPIIGAGLYVDNDVGAAGSTGRGEENIRVAGGHTIVEMMRQGKDPTEACLEALRRIARNFNNDKERLSQVGINFYALRKDGVHGCAGMWKRKDSRGQVQVPHYVVNESGTSVMTEGAHLFEA